MHQTQRWLVIAIAAAFSVPFSASAQSEPSSSPNVLGGDLTLNARLRYESVTDDAASDADALTLRSALAWRSRALFGSRSLSAIMEVENTVALDGTDYSDGETNRATALIADPPGTELNQLFIGFQSARGWRARIGRQPISFGDERFVGTVAFRQNHQSFDALSLTHDSSDDWALNYAYVANVNRIFGDAADGPVAGLLGDHKQDTHLLNAVFKGWSFGELESYAYLIGNEDFQRASMDTFGARFSGSVRPKRLTYLYTLEAASQSSRSDNPRDYSAVFTRVSGGISYKRFSVQLTQERLGSDNGSGFITPFATLHRFQGWADKFAAQTPDQGLVAQFVTIAGRWPGFRYRLQYHDFDTDVGSQNIGRELGLHVQHRVRQNLFIGIKFADYRASRSAPTLGGFDADTRRLFLSISGSVGGR
ncbi:MAG: alginate export family protein [Pseudomonadota bacterium]